MTEDEIIIIDDEEDEELEEDEEEIDVFEFVFNDEEINEMIENLKQLKETKTHFHFEIDEDNELLVHHEEEEEE
jgi:hypothetical protein